jgi:predicted nucleic acid-binding protein
MRVIVDTSVWSLALRRRPKDLSSRERAIVLLLRDLIVRGDVVLLGIVRQELLTGVTTSQTFEAMRQRLHDFDDLPPEIDDYERAASAANECARRGVSATIADMLICAVATGRDLPILTLDRDFERYAKHLPIRLVSPR